MDLSTRMTDEGHALHLDGDLRDWDRFASEHRFVDDCVTGEEDEVGWEGVEGGFGDVEDVARNDRARILGNPCVEG